MKTKKRNENKIVIKKTLRSLDNCIRALKAVTEILEEYESGKVFTNAFDKLEEVMIKTHNLSADFVKNWNNVELLISIMRATHELSEREYNNYINKLFDLKTEYENFKEGRSDSMRRLFV